MTGPSLFDQPPEPPPHRVRALACVIAGMRWPDRGSFEKLKKNQQQACLHAAKTALEHVSIEPD